MPGKLPYSLLSQGWVYKEICPDGDIVLNVYVISKKLLEQASPAPRAPNHRVRLSSEVLRLGASEFLGKVIPLVSNDKPDTIYAPPDDVLATFSKRVQVAYLHPGEIGLSIELNTLGAPSKLELGKLGRAIAALFRILHHREIEPIAKPLDWEEIVYCAEIAWALGCLFPMKPWFQLWVCDRSSKRIAENPQGQQVLSCARPTELACGLLGIALNDEAALAYASLNWIWGCTLAELKLIEAHHIIVTPDMLRESQFCISSRSFSRSQNLTTNTRTIQVSYCNRESVR